MKDQSFRLSTATLCVSSGDGDQKMLVTIPKGSEIKLLGGYLDSNQLVDIEWEGKSLKMFAVDLRTCGTSIRATREPTDLTTGGRRVPL